MYSGVLFGRTRNESIVEVREEVLRQAATYFSGLQRSLFSVQLLKLQIEKHRTQTVSCHKHCADSGQGYSFVYQNETKQERITNVSTSSDFSAQVDQDQEFKPERQSSKFKFQDLFCEKSACQKNLVYN